jgi:CspA family cold shock protein
MRTRGTVKWFSGERGYGFIAVAGSDDVFVLWAKVRGGQPLQPGQVVEFRLSQGPGGPEADDVRALSA